MPKIPMKYSEGTVKLTYDNYTSNNGGLISFPEDRRIIHAWIGAGATVAQYLLIIPRTTYDCALYYVDSSTQTVKKLAASTTYTVQYTYVLNED